MSSGARKAPTRSLMTPLNSARVIMLQATSRVGTDIQPSAEGTFTIRTSHGIGEENGGLPGAHAYKGYAGGLFLLMEQTSITNQPTAPAVEVFRLTPLNEQAKAHPNTPVQAILKHTRATVDPESVSLTVDGEYGGIQHHR